MSANQHGKRTGTVTEAPDNGITNTAWNSVNRNGNIPKLNGKNGVNLNQNGIVISSMGNDGIQSDVDARRTDWHGIKLTHNNGKIVPGLKVPAQRNADGRKREEIDANGIAVSSADGNGFPLTQPDRDNNVGFRKADGSNAQKQFARASQRVSVDTQADGNSRKRSLAIRNDLSTSERVSRSVMETYHALPPIHSAADNYPEFTSNSPYDPGNRATNNRVIRQGWVESGSPSANNQQPQQMTTYRRPNVDSVPVTGAPLPPGMPGAADRGQRANQGAGVARSLGPGSGNKPPLNTPTSSGKVQPIYVRFPGQLHGQMMFAEMNQQQGRVTIVGRDKEKDMLGRLSWLLLDAGTFALKTTFDSIHPPLSLREHLRQSHVKAVLQRLLQQGMFTEKQWKLMYPLKKQQPSSSKYDSRTLVTLLETVCHLCPPYPNGWSKQPLPQDSSLSADVLRLQLFYEEITRHDTIPGEVYAVLFAQIRDVLLRLSGSQVRVKIARIETELINLTMQQHYIQTLRDTWSGALSKKLERIHEMKHKSSHVRRSYVDKKGAEEGLSAEDRVTLMRTYKLLVDSVPAEDVLDRLQQAQVIKFSDRQEILQVAKKADRMQLLLDKILKSQLSYALKALLEAMKFKYKKVHDHVVAVRKQVHKEGVVTTVDTVGITQDALASHYKAIFSKVYPFPWSETVCGSIRDVYVPLDIVNSEGKKLHSSELFPPFSSSGRGQRILLEGESGSGKSVLCAWLAYMWATQRHYFKMRYQQVLYIDASQLQGDIETAIYKALLPDNFKLSVEEFWTMLETHGSDVMVLLDGCDISQNSEFSDILAGTRLRQSTVLVTANPETQSLTSTNTFVADTKWHILGFSEQSIKRCFRNCVALSRQNHDHFEKLYFLADSHKWRIKPHLALPMLAVKTFAIFNILRKGTMLKELKTVSDILDKYGVAMATKYCKKQKIDIIGFEFPDDILNTIVELDKFAYSCLLSNRTMFTEEEITEETSSPMVLNFGAFIRFVPGSKLKFACGIPQHYLAAKHLADMAYEDMETSILQHKMIKLPKFTQAMSFLCGQYREDVDTQILPCIFDQLAARNEYCIRGMHTPATCLTPITPSVDGDVKTKIPRGVIQDFTTSLHCLAECAGREDVLPAVAQSLPPRLIIRLDSLLTLKTVQGLVAALAHPDCAVAEVEIELHQFQCAVAGTYMQLAAAIGHCSAISAIKITWSSLELMSMFLSAVTTHSQSLETVILIEDTTRKPVKQVTAATWAALQSACANMTRVTQLSFLNCRITAIVYHVLQHVPKTLTNMNLTGCVLNLICAGVLRGYLHGNGDITFLDLSYTKLTSTEIVSIMQGMQLCEGIKHLRMRGALLDRPGVIALSEFLKLTHSLEILDLSECELSTDMCTKLTAAITQNRTLCKLVLNNTKVTSEGNHVIRHTKVDQVHVEGLTEIYTI